MGGGRRRGGGEREDEGGGRGKEEEEGGKREEEERGRRGRRKKRKRRLSLTKIKFNIAKFVDPKHGHDPAVVLIFLRSSGDAASMRGPRKVSRLSINLSRTYKG
jgi:hypothetical protein